jgi:hypothetical protein
MLSILKVEERNFLRTWSKSVVGFSTLRSNLFMTEKLFLDKTFTIDLVVQVGAIAANVARRIAAVACDTNNAERLVDQQRVSYGFGDFLRCAD